MSTLYAVFIGKPKKECPEKQKAAFEKAREALKRKRETGEKNAKKNVPAQAPKKKPS